MANHKIDPNIFAHLEWIGFIKPTGLVASAPAMVRAGAILDRRDAEGQRLLRECIEERVFKPGDDPAPYLPDFITFAKTFLGWSFSPKGYAGTNQNPIPNELMMPLPEYGETLRPDFAVRELEPQGDVSPWQLLVQVFQPGEGLDDIKRGGGQLEASPHGRMERLLRHTSVRAGLLVNGQTLRLISAPRGESSGWMDFQVADMIQTAGRPICTALRLLLSQERLLSLPRHQRLTALLDASRKFQNEVSERLAEQVLHALYELLRGFQSAHDASKGELLRTPLGEHPDEVYRGLITVILRLIFLLYAEERDMLPEDETFLRYYSLASLYERLREDAALFPDTMDQRFGAWAQLIALFRMIYNGAEAGMLRLPKRHGVLFDPNRFPFLEGRAAIVPRKSQERLDPPLVPDGTVYRALEKLLILDGEHISYRALDVEQIGSVYQTMMGFRLETATGRSIAIKADKKYGAPSTVDLEALVAEPATKREKWLQDHADRKFTDRVKNAMKEAKNLEDLHAALQPVIDLAATPDLVPGGAMILQPSEERRRSGSHYTPRELTEPIVRTTLAPILARLRGKDGKPPRPEQILSLKIADLAMGSGAFLVETCRQVGDALVESWHFYGVTPAIPADEDEIIFARRLVAQRCLYGVDRNPMAVDLAKVSLWLVTLAKDHPLTFLDHALRHGDSLVGLSRKQIEIFHWNPDAPRAAGFETTQIQEHLKKASELRHRIREANESVSDELLQSLWSKAVAELATVRLFGDLVLAAFFEGENPKAREQKRSEYATDVVNNQAEKHRNRLEKWRLSDKPLVPFHWEIEFPEVFDRMSPGFDAFVGNPPFMGGTWISGQLGSRYLDWLKEDYAEGGARSDLIAYFFRRSYDNLRHSGCLGLIATNTIAQGDTRNTGLAWICVHGGVIYNANRRMRWPGQAAVIVSVVHIRKMASAPCSLDGHSVAFISAYLFHAGRHENPERLLSNHSISFKGVDLYGMGFTFDDQDTSGVASSISEMEEIVRAHPESATRIHPYLGGEEINSSPTHIPYRWVIDLDDLHEDEARIRYPELMKIVEERVKPERFKTRLNEHGQRLRANWWRFNWSRPEMRKALEPLSMAIVRSQVSAHHQFALVSTEICFSNGVIVFAVDTFSAFAAIHSRAHEIWVRFFGSTMKDDIRYTPSDCFETFPFPENWKYLPKVESIGKAYYEFRTALMIRHNEGLTKTYNRFHDPDERDPDILELRELHAEMDRAVLNAYGWNDIPTDCDFFLDYEIDEEEYSNKKKPYRYRWPDEVHDEVLARLLELNAERAKEESLAGAAAEAIKKREKKTSSKPKRVSPGQGELL